MQVPNTPLLIYCSLVFFHFFSISLFRLSVANLFAVFMAFTFIFWIIISCTCYYQQSINHCLWSKYPLQPEYMEQTAERRRRVYYATTIWPNQIWTPQTHLSYPNEKQKQIMAFLIVVRRRNGFLHQPIVYPTIGFLHPCSPPFLAHSSLPLSHPSGAKHQLYSYFFLLYIVLKDFR